jgi:hypothetical protein
MLLYPTSLEKKLLWGYHTPFELVQGGGRQSNTYKKKSGTEQERKKRFRRLRKWNETSTWKMAANIACLLPCTAGLLQLGFQKWEPSTFWKYQVLNTRHRATRHTNQASSALLKLYAEAQLVQVGPTPFWHGDAFYVTMH